MSDLVRALREVRGAYVRDEYSNRVKVLIGDHISEMEPSAKVEDTLYFNHSAIPDFVLTWDGGKVRRDIYLRSSYAAIVAANEPQQILSGDPIFMSLDEQQAFSEPSFEMTQEDLLEATTEVKHTLLTDTSALEEISSTREAATPLASVVRSNFFRGARGLVDEPVAEALVQGGARMGGGGVSQLIREKFFEDAVYRMERTAALVQWAVAEADAGGDFDSAVLGGSLSNEELHHVLPWILKQEKSTRNPMFWDRLGSMITLEQLEQIAPEIEGIDITPLVRENVNRWSARRCYLGLNVTEDGTYAESPFWAFNSGTLALAIRERLVRVSHSGNKLRSRPGSSSPRWEAVRPHLATYKLQSVSLSGIERSFRIEAKQSQDINKDVEKVANSVEDDYFVDAVEVNLPVPGGDVEHSPVEVDFSGSLATTHRAVELGSLARVGINVIGLRGEEEGGPETLHEVLSPRSSRGEADFHNQ